jgi:hypothetical protein
MAKQIITNQYYIMTESGPILDRTEEVEIDEPTQEELIAQKEAELLKMYQELQALKTNQ